MRRNPLRGVRTVTLRKLVQSAKRAQKRRPLTLTEQLTASLADAMVKKRKTS